MCQPLLYLIDKYNSVIVGCLLNGEGEEKSLMELVGGIDGIGLSYAISAKFSIAGGIVNLLTESHNGVTVRCEHPKKNWPSEIQPMW